MIKAPIAKSTRPIPIVKSTAPVPEAAVIKKLPKKDAIPPIINPPPVPNNARTIETITEKIARRIPNSTDRQGSPIVIARRANKTIHAALRVDCC